jgi:hypothetical protein
MQKIANKVFIIYILHQTVTESKMIQAGHVAHIGYRINVFNVVVGKSEEKKPATWGTLK